MNFNLLNDIQNQNKNGLFQTKQSLLKRRIKRRLKLAQTQYVLDSKLKQSGIDRIDPTLISFIATNSKSTKQLQKIEEEIEEKQKEHMMKFYFQDLRERCENKIEQLEERVSALEKEKSRRGKKFRT